ncbi:MAG: 9-O-acetylesterase [Candidatus Hydrogenedentes bacterium]|nr:9-O-acetylesterase [Candidatus Hydrogenedentota bacterium]
MYCRLSSRFLRACAVLPLVTFSLSSPALELAPLFTSHMVLQRDMPIPIWGKAEPGETVSAAIAGQNSQAQAGADGKWMLRLAPLSAGGPHTLTITANETFTLEDVLIGDIWIGSGQSNMEMPVKVGDYGVQDAEAEIAAANYPQIRLFTVQKDTQFVPQDTFKTDGWQVCAPETVPPFSAVTYFLGRHLHTALNVPIGLIHSSWGGTLAEAWTSEASLRTMPEFNAALDQLQAEIPNAHSAQEKFDAELKAWNIALPTYDQGLKDGSPNPEFHTAAWTETLQVPGLWETQGYADLDGFAWLRRTVTIPDEWQGKELLLNLGPINDFDWTYINGIKVGFTEGDQAAINPRTYRIPPHVIKPGENTITVRVFDMGNKGGFHGEAGAILLTQADDLSNWIALAGAWEFRIGAALKDLPPRPSGPMALLGNPNVPTVLYNAMIHPLVPFALRGVIWYQGESNTPKAYQYRELFPTLINDWRRQWQQGEFPFLFVQLANWQPTLPEPGESAWAELREAQLLTLRTANTGMATIIDIGDAVDIHPKNKQDVGKRLALAALHVSYGEDLVYQGPMYERMETEGNAIRLHFTSVGGGLTAKDGDLKGFAIAGADHKFHWAQATIDGNTIVVSCPEVPEPLAVRYAWADNPVCNLFNQEGLPASPFRTDDWPGVTANIR